MLGQLRVNFAPGGLRHGAGGPVASSPVERPLPIGREAEDRHAALHSTLPDGRKQMDLLDPLGRNLPRDGGEKAQSRLVRHALARAATSVRPRWSSSRSTKMRRMCMKSCAFVTTPNAWCVPRSLSLLT